MNDTPRTDAATAAQASAYLMFQEVVRVSRELERENAKLREALELTAECLNRGIWTIGDPLALRANAAICAVLPVTEGEGLPK